MPREVSCPACEQPFTTYMKVGEAARCTHCEEETTVPEGARDLEGTPSSGPLDSGALATSSLFVNPKPAPPATAATARRYRSIRLVGGMAIIAAVGGALYFELRSSHGSEVALMGAGVSVLFSFIMLVALFASRSTEQVRREVQGMHDAASSAGMQYTLEGACAGNSALWTHSVFDKRPYTAAYIFQGNEDEFLFDYTVGKTHMGEFVGMRTITVAAFRVAEEIDFTVMPRAPGSAPGPEGINPIFSQNFDFSGTIPALLSEAACDELVSRGNWTVQGACNWITVFEKGKRVPTRDRPDFIRGVRRLVELIRS